MKIAIYTDDGQRGFVSYVKGDRSLMVTHPDPSIREKIRTYLKTKRDFIVGGREYGDRLALTVTPIDHPQYVDLALCEMYHHIGVHVDWNDPDNEHYNPKLPEVKVENQQADKPIIKSVDGGTDYEIIN